MKFLIFGTGEYYRKYIKWFDPSDVIALIDNDPKKENSVIDGFNVLSPKNGVKLEFDGIMILSFFFGEMKEQLISLGVPEDKIFHFYDIRDIIDHSSKSFELQKYISSAQSVNSGHNKRILLLSQDMELTGPAIALFKMARILKKNNYDLTVGSMLDGKLRDKFVENDIDLVIDVNMQVKTMSECPWTEEYDIIVCNTLNFHNFLRKRDNSKKILWWLHDHSFFYEGAKKSNFDLIPRDNLKVYTVGPIAKRSIKKYLPDVECNDLLYGVEDIPDTNVNIKKNDKLVFAVIGYINSIKGQDLTADAFELLDDEYKSGFDLIFAGNDKTLMAEELKYRFGNYNNARFTGILSRDELENVFNMTDMLICPSRIDVMPTVCAEAMAHGVPCLVSDSTGIAEYISDHNAGMVFSSERADDLAVKIKNIIDNRADMTAYGKNARKLYEKMFSMDIYEKNLLDIIENM